jgi:hypothetical protein
MICLGAKGRKLYNGGPSSSLLLFKRLGSPHDSFNRSPWHIMGTEALGLQDDWIDVRQNDFKFPEIYTVI